MIHSVRFTAVLDTNVIYPLVVRDLLFWLAYYDMYTPKWSKHIFDEWRMLMSEEGVPDEKIKARIAVADSAFPDALVTHYQSIIGGLELPDEKDRHVLAAAIKTNANVIVTNNLKDFPEDYLCTFGLSARCPDDFITDVIDLNPDDAIKAFRELVNNKRNPDLDEYQVLDSFRRNGLQGAADYLHSHL